MDEPATRNRQQRLISWLLAVKWSTLFHRGNGHPRAPGLPSTHDFAGFDPLTGLLNRKGLCQELDRRAASGHGLALFYIDIDRFKTINDDLGREQGDQLLARVADRLRGICGADAVIGRIEADEFVVLRSIHARAAAQAAGTEILLELSCSPHRLGDQVRFVTASIGISLSPEHGENLGALLGEADAALYQAKFDGGSRCVVADRTTERPSFESRLLDRDAA
jgi:diguanylate cyclase (GGDEF)-like protein